MGSRFIVVGKFELNPDLDAAAFAEEFARAPLVQIPSLLTRASAEELHRALLHETAWTVVHNLDGTARQAVNIGQAERMKLAMASWSRAREHYSYFHDSHELSCNGEPYAAAGHPFAELVAFLNGPEFIGLARRITGMNHIARADAAATLFRPGDYLTRQDGTAEGAARLAAYELSLTPAWSPDWGGILQFIDGSGHIGRGFVPTFNTLTLFRIPHVHFVSQVALHGGLRYSVKGWLRASAR